MRENEVVRHRTFLRVERFSFRTPLRFPYTRKKVPTGFILGEEVECSACFFSLFHVSSFFLSMCCFMFLFVISRYASAVFSSVRDFSVSFFSIVCVFPFVLFSLFCFVSVFPFISGCLVVVPGILHTDLFSPSLSTLSLFRFVLSSGPSRRRNRHRVRRADP